MIVGVVVAGCGRSNRPCIARPEPRSRLREENHSPPNRAFNWGSARPGADTVQQFLRSFTVLAASIRSRPLVAVGVLGHLRALRIGFGPVAGGHAVDRTSHSDLQLMAGTLLQLDVRGAWRVPPDD